MPSSVLREPEALAQKVRVTADELAVKLVDGRTVSVPVQWYPRLAHGSPAERQNWQIIGRGVGVHWPDRGGLCPPQTADKAMNTDGASVPRRCVMESDLHLASTQNGSLSRQMPGNLPTLLEFPTAPQTFLVAALLVASYCSGGL